MARILLTTFNEPGYNLREAALFQQGGVDKGYITTVRADELWNTVPAVLLDDGKRGGIRKVTQYGATKLFGLMSLSSGTGLGWSRIVRADLSQFRSWLVSLYAEPVGCWVVGGHSHHNPVYQPMNWGTNVPRPLRPSGDPRPPLPYRPYAGFGLERRSGQLEWFGYRTATDEPRDIQLIEARIGLKAVSLILILGCNGEYFASDWQKYVVSAGGKPPLVIGWRGTHFMPKDELGLNASSHFWDKVGPKPAGTTFDDLCRNESERVIQAWGFACWKAFANANHKEWEKDQRHLWHQVLNGDLKCAAAVAPDGRSFIADPAFKNFAGQLPMKEDAA